MSLFEHFSHEHPLILKDEFELELELDLKLMLQIELEDDDDKEMLCFGCQKPILGGGESSSADDGAYSCSESDCYDFFHLHKTCAQLPKQMNHYMHHQHPLTLLPIPSYRTSSAECSICHCVWKRFIYNCSSCNFDVCLTCAMCYLEDYEFQHPGHPQHVFTSIQREALFKCDACDTEAKDLSYVCNSCPFWMHKGCATSPPALDVHFHQHPLLLVYDIPLIYQTFLQYCEICEGRVFQNYWHYFCDKCRYFVHLKCATSPAAYALMEKRNAESLMNIDLYKDLVQFPLPSKEALMDVIMDTFGKLEIENINHVDVNEENNESKLVVGGGLKPDDTYTPPEIINHWSHSPLILLEDVNNESNDNEILLCDGCILPISIAQGSFYGCKECSFFLHRFCVELPVELPVGKCPCHPQHSLKLFHYEHFVDVVICAMCLRFTNGFFYKCGDESCDFVVDICCCFLPKKIKHKAHMHPLVQGTISSGSICDACGLLHPGNTTGFKCQTCNKFQIYVMCLLSPGSKRHRWDPHPIPLICGKLYYEGVMYCEICEEEANPKTLLYHCGECDNSFHTQCLDDTAHNMRLGGKISVADIHPHNLTLVCRRGADLCFPCRRCNLSFNNDPSVTHWIVFECVGCDFFLCHSCGIKLVLPD